MKHSDYFSETRYELYDAVDYCGPIDYIILEGYEFLTIDKSSDPIVIELFPQSPRDNADIGTHIVTMQIVLTDYPSSDYEKNFISVQFTVTIEEPPNNQSETNNNNDLPFFDP